MPLMVSLWGCAPERSAGRIVLGTRGDIATMDPAQAYQTRFLQLISALGDPLYERREDGVVVPRLAAALPQVSDDGLRVRIPLRDGVVFHDGTTFDAEAMAFSLRHFRDAGGPPGFLLKDVVEAIAATGPLELELQLKEPYAPLLNLLTFAGLTPVAAAAYGDCPNETAADDSLCLRPDQFIGTGPYRLSYRNADGTQHRLDRFADYWGEPARNEGIDMVSLDNSTALFGALQTGEVDVLSSSGLEVEHQLELSRSAAAGDFREIVSPPQVIKLLAIATDRPPLDSIGIRRALALSLPRDLLSQRVSKGLDTPLRSLVPDQFPSATPSWPELNVAKARELLEAEGYCDQRRLQVPFTFRSNVPTDELVALTWQEFLSQELGDCLVLEPTGLESATVYDQMSKGAFSMVIYNWAPDFLDPENYLRPFIGCDVHVGTICKEGSAVLSGTFWFDPQADALLALQQGQEPTARTATLMNLQDVVAEGVPYIPLWQTSSRVWSRTDISGLAYDGSGWLRFSALER